MQEFSFMGFSFSGVCIGEIFSSDAIVSYKLYKTKDDNFVFTIFDANGEVSVHISSECGIISYMEKLGFDITSFLIKAA